MDLIVFVSVITLSGICIVAVVADFALEVLPTYLVRHIDMNLTKVLGFAENFLEELLNST